MSEYDRRSAGLSRTGDTSLAPVRFELIQRDDCHLCDLALAVLAEAGLPEFESIFIDGEDALEIAYGHRVPVLRDLAAAVELDWPFAADAVRALLRDEAGPGAKPGPGMSEA